VSLPRRKLLLGMLRRHRLAVPKALLRGLSRREWVMRVWRCRRLPRRKALLWRLRRRKRVMLPCHRLWMLPCHRLARCDALLRWRLVSLARLIGLLLRLRKVVTRFKPLRL
jgi:hypothetical protein